MNQATTYTACRMALERYRDIWYQDSTPDPKNFWQKSNQMDSYLRFAALATKVFGPPDYGIKCSIINTKKKPFSKPIGIVPIRR